MLLDTHVLIWLVTGDCNLGTAARRAVDQALAADELSASSISFWEAALLVAKGRLLLPRPVGAWRRELLEAGLAEIPLDGEIGIEAVSLPDLHPDPADRILLATAALRGATLITADERLLAWPGPVPRQDARR